jgi:hypothetical protein
MSGVPPRLVLAAITTIGLLAVLFLLVTTQVSDSFAENLWAELFGIVAGSALTYFVIDYVVANDRRRQWSGLHDDVAIWLASAAGRLSFALWAEFRIENIGLADSSLLAGSDEDTISQTAERIADGKPSQLKFYSWPTIERLFTDTQKYLDSSQAVSTYLPQSAAEPALIRRLATLDRAIRNFRASFEFQAQLDRPQVGAVRAVANTIRAIVVAVEDLRTDPFVRKGDKQISAQAEKNSE